MVIELASASQWQLLAMVRKWTPSPTPEFRGFRCGQCGDELASEAWHHFLDGGGFLVPVHLCTNCHTSKNAAPVEILPPTFDLSSFQPELSPYTAATLDIISNAWKSNYPPFYGYRAFCCDCHGSELETENGIAKAWHVWRNKNGVLIEYHLCNIGRRLIFEVLIKRGRL